MAMLDKHEKADKPTRIVRYGKKTSKSLYDLTRAGSSSGNDFEAELSAAPSSNGRDASVKATFNVNKPSNARTTGQKPRRMETKQVDLFDVPSSDDEIKPVKRAPPASLKTKPTGKHLLASIDHEPLTSWETIRVKAAVTDHMKDLRVSSPIKNMERSHPGKAKTTQPNSLLAGFVEVAIPRTKKPHAQPTHSIEANATSAAARLALRRQPGDTRIAPVKSASPKHRLAEENMSLPTRKRGKLNTAVPQGSIKNAGSTKIDQQINDFPDSSASENDPVRSSKLRGATKFSRVMEEAITVAQSPEQRRTVEFSSPQQVNSRSTPDDVSAALEVDNYGDILSDRETPTRHSDTEKAVALTPKQKRLWDDILLHEPVASKLHTPRTDKRRPPQRSKLIDRLKASADDEADTTMSIDEPNDVVTKDIDQSSTHRASFPRGDSSARRVSASAESKVTYAKQRSYLQEDTLEEGLMFDLPSVPSRGGSRMTSQVDHQGSNEADFELEDDDDDQAPARLRTIHELRAAGQNFSFMQDTEAVLEDVGNHNKSGTSRRRSALMELAAKLVDAAYTARFTAQSFEEKLMAELTTAPDVIADFALASALALLFSHDVPQHTLHGFAARGIVPWLSRQLGLTSDISKLARERRHNMSRVAQSALSKDFVELMTTQKSLWSSTIPTMLSPRLVSMKALELFVIRSRKSGNRSSLLSTAELITLMHQDVPDLADHAEICTAISLLEALSTSASDIHWPRELLERLGALLPAIGVSTIIPQHFLFLGLRLALNVTNDNTLNCEVFGRTAALEYLLRVVIDNFAKLEEEEPVEDSVPTLDLLILTLGILINLVERHADSRDRLAETPYRSHLHALLDVFTQGQHRATEAESMEQSTANVAYGYLAIFLANLCQSTTTCAIIAADLPGGSLATLVDAVAEFVSHHQRVDTLGLNADDGRELWRAFTARLRAVLERLRRIASPL